MFIDARKKEDVEQLVRTLVGSIVASSESEQIPVIVNESGTIAEHASATPSAKKLVAEEVSVEQTLTPSTDDVLKLDESSLEQVATLEGVNGVTLTNSIGELLHSTINDDDINEFIAFLSGVTPMLEDASNMGRIHRIMLRGPQDDNLTVFVEEERSLGVSSDKAVSVPALSQKVEDMLQWV